MQQEEQQALRAEGKKHNKFVRFILKSWQPVPTWQSTIALFLILGIALLVFGGVLIAINASIVEVSQQYDTLCQTPQQNCQVKIHISETMKQPIYFYYEIDNFYQNHRRYIKSKSSDQLAGKEVAASTLNSDCDPAVTNAQLGVSKSINGNDLVATDIAVPCGLIAKSLFTDTYNLYSGTTNITIIDTGIAWPSDVNNKFKNSANTSKQWHNMEDEHFIVWMRTAGLPNFRKLWGRIEQDLAPGDYIVYVNSTYVVSDFGGKKYVVLSTTGPFGGKNYFLAIAYLAVGGVCILITIFFAIRWRQYSKKNL